MEYLFVGGPFDGKRFNVPDGAYRVKFRKPPKLCIKPVTPSTIDNKYTLEDESYFPERLRGKFREFIIYRHETTGIDDMISYLIENYKKL
jgi:hypothetical protein